MIRRRVVQSILVIAAVLLNSGSAFAHNWLFKNGHSSYQIVVSLDASKSEMTAARELQDYLFQISGVSLPITHDYDPHSRHIFVGYSPRVAELTKQKRPAEYDESFTYCRIGHDLLIWGGSQRGTMYGVFTFLERELGVHWLSPDCTVVPQRKKWRLPKLNHCEHPAIAYRYNNYYVTHGQPAWSAHVKENMNGPLVNDYGNQEGYWSCHTMGVLVSPNEFYQSHPEYFSLCNGKRLSQREQLCLSNPDVLQLCKDRMIQVMRDNPNFLIYSLSQNDNSNYCQCERCVSIENKYGGHSGLIIWFVNQVAEAVYKEFPNKYVGTFAYRYSRKPPVGIVPRENVVVRLCSIECCFAHPLTADCPQNVEFMKDLSGWAEIAPQLFIWDYIVNYAQFLAPWPNFQVLAPNIQTFRDNKAIGVFEEAQYVSLGGEFEEMKTWVVNQLLWNPDQDVDSLVNIFIEGYYGNAANSIRNYYQLCQSLVKTDIHFGIYIQANHEIYNDVFLRRSFSLLDKAIDNAEDETIKKRVERVRMQPLYLYCVRHKQEAFKDGKWDELVGLMKKYNARPGEGERLEDYIRQ